MATIPESLPLGGDFNAVRWISEWSDHGGIVILVDERLYLRRRTAMSLSASSALDRLSAQLIREGGLAVADYLGRRRDGDIPG